MAAYLIAEHTITDPAKFEEYRVKVGPMIAKHGEAKAVFDNPRHEYTRMLLSAEPKGSPPSNDAAAPVVLETKGLKVWFPIKAGVLRRTIDHIKAVDEISIEIHVGESLGGIIGVALIGQAADHLELLAGAPSLIVDHHHRAAIALEDDVIAIIAMFDHRRLVLLRLRQVILPHVMRRIDVNIGVEDGTPSPVFLSGASKQRIGFAHRLSPYFHEFEISN